MKAKFTKFEQSENWCSGVCGNYAFEAKSFDTGSSFGIDNGRVSKLHIWHKDKKGCDLMSYERGWDIRPSKAVKPAYTAIMELLENAPMRF